MDWHAAVQETPGGCALLLDVTPGSKHTKFPNGFDPWRGRIGVRVHAPAQDGKANQAVLAAVAHFFHVPPQHVHLESGGSDRRKLVAIEGLDAATARRRLDGALGDES